MKSKLVKESLNERIMRKTDEIDSRLYSTRFKDDKKNIWLLKLKEDLEQNKYNLRKAGILLPDLERGINNLLQILAEDYDM